MSKRKKRSSRARARARRNVVSGPSRSPQTENAAASDEPSHREYAYVSQDLKRVTILAAALFGLLIALSFFIR
jgi:hypothetical protein